MSNDLIFPLDDNKLLVFLKERTDLYERFSIREDNKKEYDFLAFCEETIWDDAKVVQWADIPFTYYDDIDVYRIQIMKYQAIFFVTPGPEHDPLGYYLNLTEAIDAADQHISEVYNEYAYEAYYSQKKANGEEPTDEWNFMDNL